jgi:hypothetical protein
MNTVMKLSGGGGPEREATDRLSASQKGLFCGAGYLMLLDICYPTRIPGYEVKFPSI